MGQKESKLQEGRRHRGGEASSGPSGTASGSGSPRVEPPYERRETRQEREARKLEKERLLREKERERSMREEHVDGGFLVTLGTYTGTEDFSKPIVRQLQIERRLAPFWRGLNDFNPRWTEHQIIAAARALPIPAADEPPPDNLIPRPVMPQSPTAGSSGSLNKLTVPIGPRSLSMGSEHSIPGSSGTTTHRSGIKAKSKALATTLIASRNVSQTDLAPREISLPRDPFVNGQSLEVSLYKEPQECPICFLDYPPFLNRTRCCDQPICSECFVQIKRPDPHFPEHHGEDGEDVAREEANETQLVSEPATCPYCQTPELGVTYEPPSFRRGLAYASNAASPLAGGSMNASSGTVCSAAMPVTPTFPPSTSRRRAQSLAANAPGVITTDHVRPDWKTKLESMRSHQARRAAAATALHTATYLMGTNSEGRSLFGRPSRLSRRQIAALASGAGTGTETSPSSTNVTSDSPNSVAPEPVARAAITGSNIYNAQQVEDLEELMLAEAMRLSLVDEEARKKKAEKDAKKDAKRKEKEEKEDLDRSDDAGAAGSASGLNRGRMRGNSAASNLRIEASIASASARHIESSPSTTPASPDKGKAVDRFAATGESEDYDAPNSPSSTVPSLPVSPGGSYGRGPSHLRQMSNASSVSSSVVDSTPGSFTGLGAANPRVSVSVGDDSQRDSSNAPNEPMFNFRSLAEMVGVNIEGEEATRQMEVDGSDPSPGITQEDVLSTQEVMSITVQTNTDSPPSSSGQAKKKSDQEEATKTIAEQMETTVLQPELTITPTTPATEDHNTDSKRLGADESVVNVKRHVEITQ